MFILLKKFVGYGTDFIHGYILNAVILSGIALVLQIDLFTGSVMH